MPEGQYPRVVATTEVTATDRDPLSGDQGEHVVSVSQPQVVATDASPPVSTPRRVGNQRITPQGEQVQGEVIAPITPHGELSPGAQVRTVERLHDLDTGETTISENGDAAIFQAGNEAAARDNALQQQPMTARDRILAGIPAATERPAQQPAPVRQSANARDAVLNSINGNGNAEARQKILDGMRAESQPATGTRSAAAPATAGSGSGRTPQSVNQALTRTRSGSTGASRSSGGRSKPKGFKPYRKGKSRKDDGKGRNRERPRSF